jgi:prenyltransferase beta subunit
MKDALLTGKLKVPDPPITISYGLIGLAAEGYKPDEYTDSLVKAITDEQMANGSFRVFASRPPMESSAIAGTALSIRALQLYGKDAVDRIRRATEWLVNATPRTSEERSMQLLGLTWAKANPDRIRTAGSALLAEQRVDGGWGQLPTLETDAYATGQAMYALAMAGMLRTSDAAYQRGAMYLLRTQRPDGSWLVKSRSVPFQPYKESGFPHGKDQWISAAGTSWAALALTVPAAPAGSQISQTF